MTGSEFWLCPLHTDYVVLPSAYVVLPTAYVVLAADDWIRILAYPWHTDYVVLHVLPKLMNDVLDCMYCLTCTPYT